DLAEAGSAIVRLNDVSDVRLDLTIEAPDLASGVPAIQITDLATDYYLIVKFSNVGSGTRYDISSYDGIIVEGSQEYLTQKSLTIRVPISAGQTDLTVWTLLNNIFEASANMRIVSFSAKLDVAPGTGNSLDISLRYYNPVTDAWETKTLSFGETDIAKKDTTAVLHQHTTQYMDIRYTSSSAIDTTEAYVTLVYQLVPP
ncbi:MAG: hypothetical protein DRN91_09255, partial [Candidatus Alkanophagales archaeon]